MFVYNFRLLIILSAVSHWCFPVRWSDLRVGEGLPWLAVVFVVLKHASINALWVVAALALVRSGRPILEVDNEYRNEDHHLKTCKVDGCPIGISCRFKVTIRDLRWSCFLESSFYAQLEWTWWVKRWPFEEWWLRRILSLLPCSALAETASVSSLTSTSSSA